MSAEDGAAPWEDGAARLIDGAPMVGDGLENSIRPLALEEFVGQRKLRENLRIFIDAARTRGDALDHTLFYGPPGLGKTTLAQIVARELGVNFRATSGPVIAKAGDLAALLTICRRAMSYSSTKFTASTRRWRKFCTRRWRIFSST